MSRLVSLMVVFALASGCASSPETGDDPTGIAPENVGRASLAASTTYSVSTRSPVVDNTIVKQTSSYGSPGLVPDADAGLCWITKISGSFRGANEYARIMRDPQGYYYAAVRSNTYDGVPGVGPAMTMKCRHLSDFVPLSKVSTFATDFNSASVNSTSGTGSYAISGSFARREAIWPWAGVDGRLDESGNPSYNTSVADRAIGLLFVSVARQCPLSNPLFCSMMSTAWQTYSTTGQPWTYAVIDVAANNDDDKVLSNAPPQTLECFVDGVNGEWRVGTSAEVKVIDNRWHLVTTKGGGEGMGARAACIPIMQGF